MERIIGPNGSWHPNALRLINNCNFHSCLSNSSYVIWGAKCLVFPGVRWGWGWQNRSIVLFLHRTWSCQTNI